MQCLIFSRLKPSSTGVVDGEVPYKEIEESIYIPARRFVDSMERFFRDVRCITMETVLPPAYTAVKSTSSSYVGQLGQIAEIAQYVVSITAARCDRLQELRIISPHVWSVIPYTLDPQVNSLTVEMQGCTTSAEQQETDMPDHVKLLLDRLQSLTLLHPSGLQSLPCSSSTYKSLKFLDLGGQCLTSASLTKLPVGLVELRFKMSEREYFTSPDDFLLPELKRLVLNRWGMNGNVVDISGFLLIAPCIKEIVMRQESSVHGSNLSKLVGDLDCPDAIPALNLLHERMTSGVKLCTQSWRSGLVNTAMAGKQQGFLLHIDFTDSGSRRRLSRCLEGLQPCPLFTNIVLQGENADIIDIHEYFPRLSQLQLMILVTNPYDLAVLDDCASLSELEVEFAYTAPTSQICKITSWIPALKALTLVSRDDSISLNRNQCKQLARELCAHRKAMKESQLEIIIA